jgi:hypothetical protein
MNNQGFERQSGLQVINNLFLSKAKSSKKFEKTFSLITFQVWFIPIHIIFKFPIIKYKKGLLEEKVSLIHTIISFGYK